MCFVSKYMCMLIEGIFTNGGFGRQIWIFEGKDVNKILVVGQVFFLAFQGKGLKRRSYYQGYLGFLRNLDISELIIWFLSMNNLLKVFRRIWGEQLIFKNSFCWYLGKKGLKIEMVFKEGCFGFGLKYFCVVVWGFVFQGNLLVVFLQFGYMLGFCFQVWQRSERVFKVV